jgi:putative ABC transport system permease protein
VLIFTAGLTLLTALIFGLVPALQGSRVDQAESLKESSRGNIGARNRFRGLLMTAEIAMSFVLLVGAGLLIKSFIRLREVNSGINPDNVLTFRLSAPPGKFTEDKQREQFFQQTLDQVRSTPGVQSAGIVLSLPLGADALNLFRGLIPEGHPIKVEEALDTAYLTVSPDYFRTLQIPLIAGRAFDDRDTDNSPKVAIINEYTARKLWPDHNWIGRKINIYPSEQFQREVVGVVRETKRSLADEPVSQMYVPYGQDATWPSMSFAIRTNGDPAAVFPGIRNQIRSFEKGAAIFNVSTMNDVLGRSVAPRRTPMLLLSAFAGAALLLALIGIYGVTAYYVTQRTQEIGIRIALGAQVKDVISLVLRSGLVLTTVGVVIGLAGALALTRWIKTLLFAVNPTDWVTLIAVCACVLVTALFACLIPARRATKVDPLTALRYE